MDDNLKEIIFENNVTLVFEVIDPIWDPHIEEYYSRQLVFLRAIKNQLDFEIDFQTENKIKEMFFNEKNDSKDGTLVKDEIILRKSLIQGEINSYKELIDFIGKYEKMDKFSKDGIEGFVFIEKDKKSPFMFKYKSSWYKYWKQVRGIIGKFAKIQKANESQRRELLNRLKSQYHDYETQKFINWGIENIERINFGEKNVIEIRKIFLENI